MTIPFQVVRYHSFKLSVVPACPTCMLSQVHDCYGWCQLGECHCTFVGHLLCLVFILPVLRAELSLGNKMRKDDLGIYIPPVGCIFGCKWGVMARLVYRRWYLNQGAPKEMTGRSDGRWV